MPIHIHLVRDIHRIFERSNAEFLPTSTIVDDLICEHPERWGSGSSFGRDLTAQRLGRMLVKNFSIRSTKDTQDVRGYYKSLFRSVWRAIGLDRQFTDSPSMEPSKPSEVSEPAQLCDMCTTKPSALVISGVNICEPCKRGLDAEHGSDFAEGRTA